MFSTFIDGAHVTLLGLPSKQESEKLQSDEKVRLEGQKKKLESSPVENLASDFAEADAKKEEVEKYDDKRKNLKNARSTMEAQSKLRIT